MTNTLQKAVEAFSKGQMVIVVDDASRENEGDLFIAAEHTTPDAIAFMLQHTSGFVCVATTGEVCDRLALPQMVVDNTESHGTAFTVTVDAASGVTTGISASDRSMTIRALASSLATPSDFARPGHVHVLRCADNGLRQRKGHTEAAVELALLSGLQPTVTICEVVSNDKLRMANRAELNTLAHDFEIPIIDVSDIALASTQSSTIELKSVFAS